MTLTATPFGGILLDQADHWCAWGDEGQLVRLRLEDMTPTHRRRTLAWLREHADQLHGQAMDTTARLHRRGQLTTAEYAAELRELEAIAPAVWLDDRPLVRRLVQLVDRRPARPRRGILRHLRRRTT